MGTGEEDSMSEDHRQIVEMLFAGEGLELDDGLKAFLASTDVTDTYYAWAGQTASIFSARLAERALKNHAVALIQWAKASERHAASLTFGTWVLAAATVLLAIATIALIFR